MPNKDTKSNIAFFSADLTPQKGLKNRIKLFFKKKIYSLFRSDIEQLNMSLKQSAESEEKSEEELKNGLLGCIEKLDGLNAGLSETYIRMNGLSDALKALEECARLLDKKAEELTRRIDDLQSESRASEQRLNAAVADVSGAVKNVEQSFGDSVKNTELSLNNAVKKVELNLERQKIIVENLDEFKVRAQNTLNYFSDFSQNCNFRINVLEDSSNKIAKEFKKIEISNHYAVSPTCNAQSAVYQIVPVFNDGDAVCDFSLLLKKQFDRLNVKNYIYSYQNNSQNNFIKPMSDFKYPASNDIMILHMAAENEMADYMGFFGCKRVLVFQNVTPPEFFADYNEFALNSVKNGIAQVKALADSVDYSLTVSEFNKETMVKCGFKPDSISVVPIPFDESRYACDADSEFSRRFSDGKTNILFVGRVAPNKRHEDLIDSFIAYHNGCNRNSRLILAGRFGENDRYYLMLKEKLADFDGEVVFTGYITQEQLVSLYRAADVFLCLSEHEGFCVPIIEAMYFDVPIIAYRSTAVTATLGEKCFLIDSKQPDNVSRCIDLLVKDKSERKQVIGNQRIQFENYSMSKFEDSVSAWIKKIEQEGNRK